MVSQMWQEPRNGNRQSVSNGPNSEKMSGKEWLSKATPAPEWLRQQTDPHCLLCGGPTYIAAVFVPNATSVLAPPPGKLRMIPYSLCRPCAEKGSAIVDQVEALLEARLRRAGVI